MNYFWYQKDMRGNWQPRSATDKPEWKVKNEYPIRSPVHSYSADLTLDELVKLYPAPNDDA